MAKTIKESYGALNSLNSLTMLKEDPCECPGGCDCDECGCGQNHHQMPQIDEDKKSERLAKIARAAAAREKDQAAQKQKAKEKHYAASKKSRESVKHFGNKDQFGRVREEEEVEEVEEATRLGSTDNRMYVLGKSLDKANYYERQQAYFNTFKRVHGRYPTKQELRAAGVGKGGDNPAGEKAYKAAMAKLKKNESVEIDEAKMGAIANAAKKGNPPYAIVAIEGTKVVAQETTMIASAVPAHVKEMKSKYPKAKIAVEGKSGKILHTEQINEAVKIPKDGSYSLNLNSPKKKVSIFVDHEAPMRDSDTLVSIEVNGKEELGKEVSSSELKKILKNYLDAGKREGARMSITDRNYPDNPMNEESQRDRAVKRHEIFIAKRTLKMDDAELAKLTGHMTKDQAKKVLAKYNEKVNESLRQRADDAMTFDNRQAAFSTAFKKKHGRAPTKQELRDAGVGKGGDNPAGAKAYQKAMSKLRPASRSGIKDKFVHNEETEDQMRQRKIKGAERVHNKRVAAEKEKKADQKKVHSMLRKTRELRKMRGEEVEQVDEAAPKASAKMMANTQSQKKLRARIEKNKKIDKEIESRKQLRNRIIKKKTNEDVEITESDKDEYDKLMKQYGDMPMSKVPMKARLRIRELGRSVRGDKGGPTAGDLVRSMKQNRKPASTRRHSSRDTIGRMGSFWAREKAESVKISEMDPKLHVSEKDGKFNVANIKGKIVKTFDNEKGAVDYANANHDDLMKETMIGRTKPSRELNVQKDEKPHLAGVKSLKIQKRAASKAERKKGKQDIKKGK